MSEVDTMDEAPAPDEAHRFPCESCGAQLVYQPGETEMVCPFCGHRQDVETAAARAGANVENDFEAALGALSRAAPMEESRVAHCTSCGADIEIEGASHAERCPFCDTPIVADTGTHRHIKPQGILPFTVTEDGAREALRSWLGSLWFAPNGVKEYARSGRRMNGVYVPYWTFDADTASQYRGRRGDHYYVTRTRTVNGKRQTYQERRTRWRAAAGRVSRFFDDVLVLASTSLPKAHADALEPWDLTELRDYSPQFVAGFRAEGYQVELADGYGEARQIMDRIIRADVRRDIGGDVQQITALDTRVSDVTFKHVLLPIWIAAYKFKGRTFRFVVNGQTGEVQGERPYSAWKITLAAIAALILGGIALYLYGQAR
ncbi:primosomal protein N' (replication factor Y) - superfamily II helicase [Wenxinia saemankumensis]|uniref:Replication restart DNA helicase PriA n=1 Tax=Wenxinia saemankumensis TaxID=1447782 RepID=A0A1M6C232_9RHOB|nr:primosomal protein N' (replication factor Y) - superfamily II helicase [Wenxinia saemankumensis]SHI55115.1 hypothetical protein SAMN05444417_0967 [Wenxinia saemankumensis]